MSTDRNDAIREVGELIGSEGSQQLAERVVEHLGGWRGAVKAARGLSDEDFGLLVEVCAGELEQEELVRQVVIG